MMLVTIPIYSMLIILQPSATQMTVSSPAKTEKAARKPRSLLKALLGVAMRHLAFDGWLGMTYKLPGEARLERHNALKVLNCFFVSSILRTWILSIRCSTLRPPMIGSTYGAFKVKYADAMAVTDSIPCSAATFSRASLILTSFPV
jgi:hypothetical protein